MKNDEIKIKGLNFFQLPRNNVNPQNIAPMAVKDNYQILELDSEKKYRALDYNVYRENIIIIFNNSLINSGIMASIQWDINNLINKLNLFGIEIINNKEAKDGKN